MVGNNKRKREDELQVQDQQRPSKRANHESEIAIEQATGWNSLPIEIAQFILSQIAFTQSHALHDPLDQRDDELKANLIVCRFVCKQWRDILPAPWFRVNIDYDFDFAATLAGQGYLGLLQWARATGCSWNENTTYQATEKGHFEVFKWAIENGCPWDDLVSCELHLARGGHLELLKWAREKGCSWSKQVCAAAAEGGHLDVLKWLRENGCPWGSSTCSLAALNGHLEVLKWARENRCSWVAVACKLAAKNGHLGC